MIEHGNIFDGLPDEVMTNKLLEPLASSQNIYIERIVSTGQATPENEWLVQQWNEWVLLLKGQATLVFEGDTKERMLEPGDWFLIPANQRHRVARTVADEITIWLAVNYHD